MKTKLITLMMALALFTGVKAQESDVWFDANFGTQEWWDALHTASIDQVNVDNGGSEIVMDTLSAGNALNFAAGNTFVLENVQIPNVGVFRINGNGFRDAAPLTSVCGDIFEYSIRLRNGSSTVESFIEFPEFPNAGAVTVYAVNQNATTDSHLSLQKKSADGSKWDTIGDQQILPGSNSYAPGDYKMTFAADETGPVTLRLWRTEARFLKIYRIVLEKNGATSIKSTSGDKSDLFANGKTLSFSGNVNNGDLSVFDLTGNKVFNCKVNSGKIDLQNIDSGIYIAKLVMGQEEITKKVVIK